MSGLPRAIGESGELVLSTLREHDIDFVVLAGFLARVPDNILHAYPNKMINIHPSFAAQVRWKGMYGDRVHEAVIASGERKAVLPSIIRMSIMTKAALSASRNALYCQDDTPEELAQRIHRLEYEYYPKVIEELVEGPLSQLFIESVKGEDGLVQLYGCLSCSFPGIQCTVADFYISGRVFSRIV